MVTRVATVAFEGIEARAVDVQVQITSGNVAFVLVGLPDKAVAESKERVRAALTASGLALPARRIVVNLAPADLPKEGSHYDLPIALGIMAAIGAIPPDALEGFTALGELALDGSLTAVAGVLPAAVAANGRDHGLICPAACGSEAAWAGGDIDVLAPLSLIQLANHFKGTQTLARPEPKMASSPVELPDLRDIKGQESAKRALEIAAAGGHNLLFSGPPGSGKSMLAARLPSILPPLSPRELLEVSMVHSVAGVLADGVITDRRPFRAPHHSASMAALTGGGLHARPGEVSLAHHGVLFLDEVPEFSPQALDSLRQPLEIGEVAVSRANHRVTYPARFQLISAMNPCSRVAFFPEGISFIGKANRHKDLDLSTLAGQMLLLRRRRKLRQQDVAELLGVDTFTVIGWEASRHAPEARHIPKLLCLLGTDWRPEPCTEGERLRHTRETLGLTQKGFAKAIGHDPATILRWETDKGNVPERVWGWIAASVSEASRQRKI